MKNKIKLIIRPFFVLFMKIFSILPIKRQILFAAYGGKQYSCNPKSITEYLLKNYPGEFTIIWAFRNPEKFKFLEERGVRVVKYLSLRHFFYLGTSKILVSNVGLSRFFCPNNGQFYVETWHGGGAYKKFPPTPLEMESIEHCGRYVNLFLSGNTALTKYVLRGAFRSSAEVFEVGTPRNDIFFTDYSDVAKCVRKYYDIPDDVKIVLYAPTWRENRKLSDYDFDYSAATKALSSRFGSKWVCMFRTHHMIKSDYSGAERVIDASKYPDMQELLCAADVLVTDYSSSMWDFSLTFKPCFIYATDIESYIQERDFYTPMSEWPFPIARDNQELAQNIANFDEQSYIQNVKKHHEDLGLCETGHAAQSVCERICEVMK